jgi:transcription elongation factor GreA
MTAVYLTTAGLERLRTRLAETRAAFKAVCDDNPAAREAGDSSVWHDNFAFEENQRRMHMLAARVRELESTLERVVVVSPPKVAPERVAVGTRVRYRFDDEPQVRTCVIAGWEDGDKRAGRVSYNSPLGEHLVGARVGAVVEVELAGRYREVTVVAVELAEEGACAA